MKKIILFLSVIATILSSCSSEPEGKSTTIEGRFVGSNVDSVYLERVSDTFVAPERIAAQALADNGGFKFSFDIEDGTRECQLIETRRGAILDVERELEASVVGKCLGCNTLGGYEGVGNALEIY